MDCVISELRFNRIILQSSYRKVTIYGHFPIITFVKFNGKIIWDPQHDRVISKSVF